MFNPIQLVSIFFNLIYLSILARIILTLVVSFMSQPPPMLISVTEVMVQVTEPILAPIRRVLPTFGMIDFSPMVAILLLVVIERLLIAVMG